MHEVIVTFESCEIDENAKTAQKRRNPPNYSTRRLARAASQGGEARQRVAKRERGVEMDCSQDPGKAPETPSLATHASVGGLSTWVAGEDTWEGLGTGAVVTGSARGGEGEFGSAEGGDGSIGTD